MYKRLYFLVLILSLALASCSEYAKVMKSGDSNLKLTKAFEYYEKKDYTRALPLLEDLVAGGMYRGTEKAEKIYHSYAWCHYHMKEYYLAAYYFKMFTKTYPNSVYAEECLFMSAMCNVKNSPNWSLDQTETIDAINELQLFLNRYPESRRRDTSNVIMDQMYYKLETKAFENAYLYYKIQNYRAASIALKSMVEEYPNSRYAERAMYLIVKSDYLLATNSIDKKKQERFEQTLKSYANFVSLFPQSAYRKELDGIQAGSVRELEILKTTTAK